MADVTIPPENVKVFLPKEEARKDVERACRQFGLTLTEFAYAFNDPRGGRVLIGGDYVALPQQPLYALDSADVHLVIRVALGESEKTFSIFGVPPEWAYWGIRRYLEPRFEEWIVDLMTGGV